VEGFLETVRVLSRRRRLESWFVVRSDDGEIVGNQSFQ